MIHVYNKSVTLIEIFIAVPLSIAPLSIFQITNNFKQNNFLC